MPVFNIREHAGNWPPLLDTIVAPFHMLAFWPTVITFTLIGFVMSLWLKRCSHESLITVGIIYAIILPGFFTSHLNVGHILLTTLLRFISLLIPGTPNAWPGLLLSLSGLYIGAFLAKMIQKKYSINITKP